MSGYALELDYGSAAAWMGRAEGGVSLRIKRGEIHAVLMDSADETASLTEILTGQRVTAKGEIRLSGNPVRIASPRDALTQGIGAVYRRDGLAEGLTLLDHYRLVSGAAGSKKRARSAAEALAGKYGLKTEWDIPVRELSSGERFRGELVLALAEEIDILVLEEPGDRLSPLEMENIWPLLRHLTQERKTVLLITRRPACAQMADACTDLTSGREGNEAFLPPLEKLPIAPGSVTLEARNLTLIQKGGEEPVLRAVSLEARAGETTAVLGLPGSGLEELALVLAGMEENAQGRVRLNGKDISALSARERMKEGIAFAPGREGGYGLSKKASLPENMILRRYRDAAFKESGFLRKGEMRRYAEELLEKQDAFPSDDEMTPAEKQRAALAREMDAHPEALIALKPTEGLNRKDARDIQNRLLAVRNGRRSLIVLTEDIEEAMTMGDRILVLCRGEIAGEFEPGLTSARELGLYMTGDRQQGREEPFDDEE